ncbi:MAG TPA: tetratricopeptide repeat protein [Aquabacterium sp.]|uniref:tetratricopeptide repeat protein n=1 Tax=Aquabacterium sp. TaxID=1872578 RepID=UPI002E2F1C0A|nr:tetratricopeptide repeat protein [Aquabacterium sp.]HEX5355646.1 tetratricopeptide repeat protein [Aquabacterium sp.]
MIDITLENFESDLIATSMQVPVLLDIWAEWCGPCKSLGPVLERLEEEYAGRFVLAKVNADEQQEIAGQLSQMFGVRSIPFCVMFVGGQPVDGFVGALPAEKIREFLSKHVPSEGEIEAAEETAEAEQLAEEGDLDNAVAKLEDALAKDPGNDEARYDLIKLLLAEGQVEAAKHIFLPIAGRATGPVPEARPLAFSRYISAVQAARQGRAPQELEAAIGANKRDFAARFELAQLFWAASQPTLAMDELLEIIMRDKAWNDELARKTYVAILEVMTKPQPKPVAGKPVAGAPGAQDKPKLEIAGKVEIAGNDPVIDQYRRKLSMALF